MFPKVKEHRHLERANRYFDSGRRDKAAMENWNVHRIEPLHPRAIRRDQAMFILGKQAGNDKAVVLLSDTAIVRVEVEDIRNRR